MTGLVTAVLLFLVFGLALIVPQLGLVLYVWLGTLYPQGLAYGIPSISWSELAIGAALLGVLRPGFIVARGRSFGGIPLFVYVFFCWTLITSMFAFFPLLAWDFAWSFTKVIIAFTLIILTVHSRDQLNTLVWAIIAGAGAIAFKGFLQVINSGGGSQVIGVPGSSFFGNNEVARLIGVGFPFMLVASYHARGKVARNASLFLVICSVIAILGTYSRGGILALAAVGGFWFLFSRNKAKAFFTAAVLLVFVAAILPDNALSRLTGRMETLEAVEEDGSLQGRFFAWRFAVDTANSSPIVGGGFGAFRASVYGERGVWKDAHSIYFEALGEHGYVGLLLYLTMFAMALLQARSIFNLAGARPDLYWERDLAFGCAMSLIFFLVGGIVASSTYLELVFIVLAVLVVLKGLVSRALADGKTELRRNIT